MDIELQTFQLLKTHQTQSQFKTIKLLCNVVLDWKQTLSQHEYFFVFSVHLLFASIFIRYQHMVQLYP